MMKGSTMQDIGNLSALVVVLVPIREADVAKLMMAEAGHVVAAFILLDEHVAGWTSLPLLEISLEVEVAGTLVPFQHALGAELRSTDVAGERLADVYHPLAVFGRAELKIGIAHSLLPDQIIVILLLVFSGQFLETRNTGVDGHLASLLRTGDLLHDADLVDDVVPDAIVAECVAAVDIDHAHFLQPVPGLTEIADAPCHCTADYEVLDVEFLHLLF
jgi:hypothetical protein